MLDDAEQAAPGPAGAAPVTAADLGTWRDPLASIVTLAPDEILDPAQQHCMYHHGAEGTPIAMHIVTHWPMTGAACRPCGESILAYLRGTPLTEIPAPDATRQAAEISLWMAKMTGHGPHDATVTGLRPRQRADHPE